MKITSGVAAALLSALPEYGLATLSPLANVLSPGTDSCCNALLNSEISDKVVFPNNKAYETSVHSYWAVNVQLQPNCIVQPLSANDVSVAVRTLSNSIPGESCKFAVRSGGHTTWAGANNIKDGVTIDLSQMNSTHYTKGAKTATIHPGARWASVYKDLEPYGVTVPGGRTGPVGVGGFLIGGGNTFHTARVGFACDNVENFEVVLASGEVVNANRHTNTDLYKALKGGTINFGIVTKYELRIIPQDTLWGGMVMYDNSTSPQQVRAINRFIDNIHNDPYASYIGMWQYSSKLDKNGITTPLEYTKPEAFPAAYNDFYQIKNISSTMRFDNMYNLTQELGQPDGFRDVFLTGTYENNVKVLSKVIDIHNHKIEEIKAQAKSKSWTLATMIQPWAKIFWEHSAERGGNMLGLDRFDRNLFQTLFDYSWEDEADDQLFRHACITALQELDEYAKSQGAYNEYIYLNYADRTQNPLHGYGPENTEYIKRVAQKYDPDGVFQTKVPGGFKISKA